MKVVDDTQTPDLDAPLFRHSLIVFDGVCNLCDRTVHFILERDPRGCFRFVPMQSPLGIALLRRFGFPEDYRDSFVYIESGRPYTESSAFIRISKRLRPPWPLFAVVAVIPRGIRDRVYAYIGRNRYRWLGRREYCDMSGPAMSHRFLTQAPPPRAD